MNHSQIPYNTTWLRDGKPYYRNKTYTEGGYNYFVYVITHAESNRRYIGKKNMCWRDRDNELHETDWRSYWGSSRILTHSIREQGSMMFEKEIIIENKNELLNDACEWAMLIDIAMRKDWKNYYNQESCMKYFFPFLNETIFPDLWPDLMGKAIRRLNRSSYWIKHF